jgi:hypothetical protein
MRMDDSRIDLAIDEVARQLTAAEPHPDFRRRVMTRIDAGSSRSARAAWFRTWGPALAGLSAAAAIVIAVQVLAPRDARLPSSSSGRVTVRAHPGASEIHVPPAHEDLGMPHTPERPNELARRVAPAGSEPVSDIEPLTTMPIELDSIAVTDLAPAASIAIQPLQPVAPLAIPSLGDDTEGDPR